VITEDRMMEIEIKIARQEDMVDALNQLVYQQQKKIAELEALCSALAMRLKNESADAGQRTVDERPPHY
jgi:SlyX protein